MKRLFFSLIVLLFCFTSFGQRYFNRTESDARFANKDSVSATYAREDSTASRLSRKIDEQDLTYSSWYTDAEVRALLRSTIDSLFAGTYVKGDSTYKMTYVATVNAPETWVSYGFDTGLVSYIGFDETSGTSFNNSIVSSNDALVNTGSVTVNQTGLIGKAVYNDGTGQISAYAQTGLINATTFTSSIWVKPTSLSNNEILTFYDTGSGAWIIAMLKSDGNISLKVKTSNTPSINTDVASTNTPISVNSWNLIAITYNGTSVKTYVNNVESVSISYIGGFGTSNGLDDPAQFWCGTPGMVGYFDQTCVWSRTLSGADLTNLYNFGLTGGGK